MWNGTQLRVGMQQALRNWSISHSGTFWSLTFTVDKSAECCSVKECKQGCISYCNRTQLIMYMDSWKDSHLWVYLDWRCYSFWLPAVMKFVAPAPEFTLNHQTRWLVISRRQCGILSGWLYLYCVVSCRVCRIWRFVVDLKHLAGSGTTYTL